MTLPVDIWDREEVKRWFYALAESVTSRQRTANVGRASTVHIVVRNEQLQDFTWQTKVAPTALCGDVANHDDLRRMAGLPGNYYNFHPGSHVGQGVDTGISQICDALKAALAPGYPVTVLLETMAGKGSEIGGRFEELKAIIDGVGFGNIGVCLDTCHVYDAGYDIVNDLDGVLGEFDRVIGLEKLLALHLNDSKNPFASHKDRHEKLGQGSLGIETFRAIVNHPDLRDKPMILETPNELPGYARELCLLRQLAE
jgi:deoxyribonuclease-4